MKTFFAFLCVIVIMALMVPSGAVAQPRLGVLGGLNLASASVSPDISGTGVSESFRMGFFGGGIVEFALSSPLFIQIEPQYAQHGKKYEMEAPGMSGSLLFMFDYIEIPVLLKARFGSEDILPYVFAGPSLSFNMSAKIESELNGATDTDDVKDEINSTTFGIDLGAGVEFPVDPKTSVLVNVRYSVGLSNVIKDPGDDESWKYQNIKIGVGVLFGL